MKRILLISYYYPPLTDVGGLRALGFSKYLPLYGWEPYVLSVRNPDKGYCSVGKDKPPRGVKVFYSWSIINVSQIFGKLNRLLILAFKLFGRRLNTNVVANLFGIPDIFLGWIPLSIIKALKIVRKYKIDIIYVSCKPFSSALIGVFLKRVKKKPLILDLRDPTVFSLYDQHSLSFKFYVKLSKAIEKGVLKKVDKIIFVTKTTEQEYLSTYPFLKGKTCHIYNGFFSEFYPKTEVKPFDTFTITYVGNYYPRYYDSELLFQTLKKIIMRGIIPRSDIKFLYLGDNTDWFKHMREKYDLSDVVICPGKVSRQESIETLFKSSVIYLRIVEDRISTKLYEGLSTGNPLLAAISNKEVIKIIKRYSPQSIITKPHDIDLLAEAIEKLYNQWKQGKLQRRVNNEYLKRFDKQFLTKEFAKELNTVVPNHSD
jgi:glycosyltransferase involved in cell wall biosynthesis